MIIINRITQPLNITAPVKPIITIKRDGLLGPQGPRGEPGQRGADGAAQIPEVLNGGSF